ncbi:MAG: DUF3793 family protein [Caecibacter sp.]|jgi:hypothetical protein|nr:DUF3793 family protein [Megasphaera sp.]MEE0721511.1 DUF3793 family protein [Caecibacter sp.]
MNIDHLLITYCAPTLAGIKMGALLCLRNEGVLEDFDRTVAMYNDQYNDRGLYFRILYRCSQRTLLYVYRPQMVAQYIAASPVASFLEGFGYRQGSSIEMMIDMLASRFSQGGCFPHESGIFLGYPLEDVTGFIEHGGNDAKLCGEWKVYGDAKKASALFAAYHCCRSDYERRYSIGATLRDLIAA